MHSSKYNLTIPFSSSKCFGDVFSGFTKQNESIVNKQVPKPKLAYNIELTFYRFTGKNFQEQKKGIIYKQP